jgi:hypothetical protein
VTDSTWYLARGTKKLGPFSTEQLKKLAAGGKLLPTDMLLQDGKQKWISPSSVEGLFPPAPAAVSSPSGLPPGLVSAPVKPTSSQSGATPDQGVALCEPNPSPTKPWTSSPILLLGCGLLAGGLLVFVAGGILIFIGLRPGGWLKGSGDRNSEPVASRPAYEEVDIDVLYKTYESNLATADAKYLNKQVQFNFYPQGVDKNDLGVYYAWSNIFGLPDPVKYGQHTKCYFREGQAAALAEFKLDGTQRLVIRGICMGKTGMIDFYYAPYFNDGTKGFNKASPAIAFKDCEVIKIEGPVVRAPANPDQPRHNPPQK